MTDGSGRDCDLVVGTDPDAATLVELREALAPGRRLLHGVASAHRRSGQGRARAPRRGLRGRRPVIGRGPRPAPRPCSGFPWARGARRRTCARGSACAAAGCGAFSRRRAGVPAISCGAASEARSARSRGARRTPASGELAPSAWLRDAVAAAGGSAPRPASCRPARDRRAAQREQGRAAGVRGAEPGSTGGSEGAASGRSGRRHPSGGRCAGGPGGAPSRPAFPVYPACSSGGRPTACRCWARRRSSGARSKRCSPAAALGRWSVKVADWLAALAPREHPRPASHWREAIVEPVLAQFVDVFGGVVDQGLLREGEAIVARPRRSAGGSRAARLRSLERARHAGRRDRRAGLGIRRRGRPACPGPALLPGVRVVQCGPRVGPRAPRRVLSSVTRPHDADGRGSTRLPGAVLRAPWASTRRSSRRCARWCG